MKKKHFQIYSSEQTIVVFTINSGPNSFLFSGTVPVLWVLKGSVPVSSKILSATPNIMGIFVL